jgi:hypothetical protein
MLGVGIIGTHTEDLTVAGFRGEAAFWYSRVGIGLEASHQWSVDGGGPRVGAVSGSLRLLVFEHMMPSLFVRREVVELGIELHGIVERAWWREIEAHREPWTYGVGLAVRLRGAAEDDLSSNLLSETRLFVRAMTSRVWMDPGSPSEEPPIVLTRDLSPGEERRGYTIIVGLGAAWGAGKRSYVEELRRRNPLDTEVWFR